MVAPQILEKYIPPLVAGKISLRRCASLMDVSLNTVIRYKNKYKTKSEFVFSHGLCGKKSNNTKTLKKETHERIIRIYKTHFPEANFNYFTWKLEQFFGIKYSPSSIYRILRKAGIASPKARRKKPKILHKPRLEKECSGELVQIDASSYDWFSDGSSCTLHGAIDDATHKIVSLYFCENECRLGYNELALRMVEEFGIPESIYTDLSTSFFTPRKRLTIEEQLAGKNENETQWQEVCRQLNIELIRAYTPQAKGRIERLWQTLQSQLPCEFRFMKIKNKEQANNYMPYFIQAFNERYSVAAQNNLSKWRKNVSDAENLFTLREYKRTNDHGIFIYHDCEFRLVTKYPAKRNFTFCLSERDGIYAILASGEKADVALCGKIRTVINDTMPAVERDLLARWL